MFFFIPHSVTLHIPLFTCTSAFNWLKYLCCNAYHSTLASCLVRAVCWWCKFQGYSGCLSEDILHIQFWESVLGQSRGCTCILIYLHSSSGTYLHIHPALCSGSEGHHAILSIVKHYLGGNESLTCIVNVCVRMITKSMLNHTVSWSQNWLTEIVLLYLRATM